MAMRNVVIKTKEDIDKVFQADGETRRHRVIGSQPTTSQSTGFPVRVLVPSGTFSIPHQDRVEICGVHFPELAAYMTIHKGTPEELARRMEITVAEAEAIRAEYEKRYPQLTTLLKQAREKSRPAALAVDQLIDCTDCKGTGEYVGFTAREVCGLCKGAKKIPNPKAKFQADDIKVSGIHSDYPREIAMPGDVVSVKPSETMQKVSGLASGVAPNAHNYRRIKISSPNGKNEFLSRYEDKDGRVYLDVENSPAEQKMSAFYNAQLGEPHKP